MLDSLLEEALTGTPDRHLVEAIGVTDRRLFEDSNFILVPSISPISVNHIMLVPKAPTCGFWQVPDVHLEAALEKMYEVYPQSRSFIQFEHGVFEPGEYRCGINHAHLHLVPEQDGFFEFLNNRFQVLSNESELSFFEDLRFSQLGKFQTRSTSYVAVRRGRDRSFGIRGKNLASQLVRRYASEFGYNCGENWRDIENWGEFNATLKEWRK